MSKAHGLGRVLWIDDRLRAIGRIDQQVMAFRMDFQKRTFLRDACSKIAVRKISI
jgi:hypothetical protein